MSTALRSCEGTGKEERVKMKWRLGLVALGLALLLASGCASAEEAALLEERVIVRDTLSSQSPGTHFPITIEDVQPGDAVGVDFRGSVISGTVSLQFTGPEGEVLWEQRVESVGPFVVNEVITATSAISHGLGLAWEEALDISYALGWQPGEFERPVVEPLALLGGIGLLVLVMAVVVYAAVRGLGWKLLGLGALVWVGVFVLKAAVAGPINLYVGEGLSAAMSPEAANLVWYAYSGVMIGLFEVVAIYLLLRYTDLGRASLRGAQSFGLAFGGAEALASGALLLFVSVLALNDPDSVPLVVPEIAVLNNPLYTIAPILEQAGKILVHCFSLVMVFYAVASARLRPVVDAFAYKFAYVAMVSLAAGVGGTSLVWIWITAVVSVVWGALGAFGCYALREEYPE
jgi:uncharacterized membrane protein YhfC